MRIEELGLIRVEKEGALKLALHPWILGISVLSQDVKNVYNIYRTFVSIHFRTSALQMKDKITHNYFTFNITQSPVNNFENVQ